MKFLVVFPNRLFPSQSLDFHSLITIKILPIIRMWEVAAGEAVAAVSEAALEDHIVTRIISANSIRIKVRTLVNMVVAVVIKMFLKRRSITVVTSSNSGPLPLHRSKERRSKE